MTKVITTLGPEDRPAILAHLLRLSPEDRYTRFFITLREIARDEDFMARSEPIIEMYVNERLNLGNGSFGIYHEETLVAFMHLTKMKVGELMLAEMDLSIDADWQGRGISRMLFERVFVHCKAEGIHTAFFAYLPQHQKVPYLVSNFGFYSTITEEGWAKAELQLEKYPLERSDCIRKDAMYDGISLFQRAFARNDHLAMKLLAPVYHKTESTYEPRNNDFRT